MERSDMIAALKTRTTPQLPTMVTLDQAAAWLQLSVRSLRRMISDGQLPAYRVAGRDSVRLKAADVEACLLRIPAADY